MKDTKLQPQQAQNIPSNVPSQNQEVVKTEVELKPDELRAVRYLSAELGIAKEEAGRMLFEQGGMDWYFKYRKNELDYDALQLIADIQSAVRSAAKRKSLTQMKDGTIALGILRQRLFGDKQPGLQFNVGNTVVNIKGADWFKPYNKNGDVIEGKTEK